MSTRWLGDWTYGGAAPKYATVRDPSAPCDGSRIALIAKALGKPGLPWQRYVWDVATEHEPNGDLRYEIVMVTVPRQTGKTTMYGSVQVDRCIMNPGIKTFYTAQTGKDARSRFRDLVELLQQSPLASMLTYRFSAGDEGIGFPNGSWLKLFAPVLAALHGETPPLVGMDEIWELLELLGDAIVEGAVIPAQMTLGGRRQLWLFSTYGDAHSTFMWKWVERGQSGKWPRMAYFEWGLPEGADPYDPQVIAGFHPAVGYTVTAEELVDLSATMSPAEWLRAFCNVRTEALDPIISSEDWAALAREMLVPSRHDIAITYDVAPDNEAGRIMATWRDLDGDPCTRVLHAAPGTRWMLDALVRLHEWKPRVMGADDGGPTRRLTDELRRRIGTEAVVTTGGKDFGTACEGLVTHILDEQTLNHDGSDVLAREVAAVVLDPLNGVRRISRTRSPACVAGLIATAVGLWLYDHPEGEDLGKPVVAELQEVMPW